MMAWYQNKIVASLIALLLIFSFVVISYGPGPHTPRAEAQLATADVGPNSTQSAIQNTISAIANVATRAFSAISSAALSSLELKEWTMDGIAFALTNLIIQQISRSLVEWINSGFQGSPAFITNLDAFLLDIADIQAGRFLTELGLGVMCAPFKLDVQLALALRYQKARKYEAQCRLSDIASNLDNFLGGNFYDGGWGGWLALTMIPSNNPHGALFESEYELGVRIANARGEARTESLFGDGFLTFKSCEEVPDEDGAPMTVCTNQTPGKVIETQLNNNLDSGRNRLVIADEINEVLGALFAQLVVQTFRGAGGLLGLTSSGYSPQGFSYVEAAAQPGQTTGGLSSDALTPLQNTIDVENRYITEQQRIISIVNSAEQQLANSCAAGSLSLPGSLVNARNNAQAGIAQAQSNIATLNSLAQQYANTTDPDEQLAIYQVFIDMQSDGVFHDEVDVATLNAITVDAVSRDASTFSSAINDFDCPSGSGGNGGDPDGDSGD